VSHVSVLIAGCGYLGSAVAERLAGRGATVFALRRNASQLPQGVHGIAADLLDPERLAGALPRGVEHVVYAISPDGPTEAAYRAAYVEGVTALLDALEAIGSKPARFVLTTSTAVYGQRDGSWVDERSPVVAEGTARWMLEGEARVGARCGRGAIALRLGGIYGPGRDRMIRMVRDRSARRPLTPLWTNRIHVDDAASAIVHLLAVPDPAPVYIGVDDEPAELGEVYAWIARELALPDPPFEDGHLPPQRRRSSNKRCRNALLRASGWSPNYPTFREGYRALLVGSHAAELPHRNGPHPPA